MDEPYVEDFFVVNRFLLQCVGLWAPKNMSRVFLTAYRIYGLITFLFVNVFFAASEVISLKDTYGDVHDLLKNIGFILTQVLGSCKIVHFYFHRHKIWKIINILESEEFHYDVCTEKGFSPGLTSKKYKWIGMKYSLGFSVLSHITLLSAYLPTAVSTVFFIYNQPSPDQNAMSYILPYYSWMPFKYDTATSFLIALGYQCIAMFSYAYSIVGFDTLFMNIMNCVACNLKLIQGAFLTIRDRAVKHVTGSVYDADGMYDSEELKWLVRNDMKKLNHHLQTIYKVCQDLENIYKYVSLTQIMATLFVLTSCLYLISSTPFTGQFFTEFAYIVTMAFQLMLYCWFGNEVTLQASKIPLNIWQCDWLTADDSFKKSMIFTMTRTEKPLFLTAGDFVPLTLPTLMSIMKGSYSFFTVIKGTSE